MPLPFTGSEDSGHRATTLVFLAAVTIAAQLVNGYHFGISDHALYVPTLLRLVRPGLFPTDYFFSVPVNDFALWFPAVAALSRVFGMETVFFMGHLLAQFALFWAIYHLSLAVFRSRGAAALAVLFLLVPKGIGGTWNDTHDTYFVARDVAIPIALGALIALYRERLVLAGGLAAATFVLHPVTGLSAVGVVVLTAILDRKRYSRGTALAAFGLMLLCIVPLLVRVLGSAHAPMSRGSFFQRAAPDWLEVVKSRMPYLFLSTWSSLDALSIAAYLTILLGTLLARWWQRRPGKAGRPNPREAAAIGAERSRQDADRSTSRVILTCAGLVTCGTIFVEGYPLSAVVELSFSRCLYLIVVLALIYAAGMLWEGSGDFWRALRSKPGEEAPTVLGLLMGTVIPLLFALVFMERSGRLVVLGTIPFLWWLALLGSSWKSTDRADADRLTPWIVGGVCVLAFALVFLHRVRVLGEHGVFGPTTLAFTAVFVGLAELERRRLGKRTSHVAPGFAGRVLLVSTAILFLLADKAGLSHLGDARHFAGRVQIPGRPLLNNDYSDVGQWCRSNTQPDALFLVPPRLEGFRMRSQRGIVGEWRDGGFLFFSKPAALGWWRRMVDLDGYDSFDEARLTELGAKYGASFAVVRQPRRLTLPVAYENGGFVVYSLSPGGAKSR